MMACHAMLPLRLDTACLFQTLLPVLDPDLVCDVGSLDGAHARRFRDRLPTARVVAFEPNPENADSMARDAELARRRIELCPKAAWSDEWGVTFHVEHGAGQECGAWRRGISSTRRRRRGSVGTTAVSIPTVRLDGFIGGLTPPPARVALWIDVEGSAFDVLQGVENVRERVVLIHVEVETVEIWDGQKLAPEVDALARRFGFVALARGFWESQHDVVYVSARALAASPLRIRALAGAVWVRSAPRAIRDEMRRAVRFAPLYARALTLARTSPWVARAIGEPIEPRHTPRRAVGGKGPRGEIVLVIPVRGPRGAATIYGEAEQTSGRWQLTTLEVAIPGQPELCVLLGSSPGSATDPEPQASRRAAPHGPKTASSPP